ncbi:NAD(P)/FAD-dependent oxidoreductase, partial [Ferrovibrio sp.]|uniref:NAD(P)/FAD-dependent oxidoreductase n=1 Tax=Ferrovibrio sp. TaxID=1917215 RepID=UPI0035AFFD90
MSAPLPSYDVIILGAGGAGLFCAGIAAGRGHRVLLLDHAARPGEKIRISGGGRCNFTNQHASAADFLSANPHFAKSALRRFTPQDFIALVNRHGIAWHEKTLGQLFCDGSAQQIIDMLLAECQRGPGEVTLRLNSAIARVEKTPAGFRVHTASADVFDAPALVVATGGASIPKMGATGLAYEIAKQFGLTVIPPKPALVPLLFGPEDARRFDGLAGVAVPDVETAIGKRRFREALLFTHRGLSGPAILQISSYWEFFERRQPITINLLPGLDLFALLKAARVQHPKQEIGTQMASHLPARLAKRLCELAGLDGRLADIGDAKFRTLAALAQHWQLTPAGTEGFSKAEVTLGGVDTASLSSQTMEARDVPGLYFIGEAVDVTGHLGGFNFQWAW